MGFRYNPWFHIILQPEVDINATQEEFTKMTKGLNTFLELCPFEVIRIKFYNQDILKSITARGMKLRQLIEDVHMCDISLFRRELPIFCQFLGISPY